MAVGESRVSPRAPQAPRAQSCQAMREEDRVLVGRPARQCQRTSSAQFDVRWHGLMISDDQVPSNWHVRRGAPGTNPATHVPTAVSPDPVRSQSALSKLFWALQLSSVPSPTPTVHAALRLPRGHVTHRSRWARASSPPGCAALVVHVRTHGLTISDEYVPAEVHRRCGDAVGSIGIKPAWQLPFTRAVWPNGAYVGQTAKSNVL